MIDAYASWSHYADHLLPIWQALPEKARGTFWATRDVISAHRAAGLAEGHPGHLSVAPVLVAGYSDHHAVRPRPTILVNHGAGQTYKASKGAESFSGGPGRERVLLHLEPGPLAARASAAAGHPHAVVGVPMLDRWHVTPPAPEPGLVAVALHHDGRGAPEQESAWRHYADSFADLACHVRLLGHGHPRGWLRTAERWRRLGVTSEPSFAAVLNRAAVLVTDISSAGPLFASTGRPVVYVSAPWHMNAPESGGRFHDWTRTVEPAGGHVTDPAALTVAVQAAVAEPGLLVAAQRGYVDDVIVACDGRAAWRAAAVIVGLLDGE